MYFRLSLWMAFLAFAAGTAVFGQSPASGGRANPQAMPPGIILARAVKGDISVRLNGVTTKLHDGDRVTQHATVITAADSSVVLLFSNGASTQLGPDTSLSIDEFTQDPFSKQVQMAQLTEEPSARSRTRLHLDRGELVGQVAHLHHDNGSVFIVDTPVGAAGIRGTIFRIVFRPAGNGQAFTFTLSTAQGQVLFTGTVGPKGTTVSAAPSETNNGGTGPSGSSNNGGASSNNGGGGTSTSGGGGSAGGGTPAGGNSSEVPAGQEITVTVSGNVDANTGQITFTGTPTIQTTAISSNSQTQIVQATSQIETQVESTTFQATTTQNSNTNSNSNNNSGSNDKNSQDQNKNSNQDQNSNSNKGNSGNDNSGNTPSNPTPTQSPSSPPPPPPLPILSNPAGQG